MNRVTIRDFKGLNQDFDQTDMNVLNATLLSDVCNTPKNALKTPNGSTKWNTYNVGFVNGMKDYKGRNGARFVIDMTSQTGHGFGGSPGDPYNPTSETVEYSDTVIDGSSQVNPPGEARHFDALRVTMPSLIQNGDNFTLTIEALDQFGAAYAITGTVSISENGLGTLKNGASTLTSMSMHSGIATLSTVTYNWGRDENGLTLTASMAGKTGTHVFGTYGFSISANIPKMYNRYGYVHTRYPVEIEILRNKDNVRETKYSGTLQMAVSTGGIVDNSPATALILSSAGYVSFTQSWNKNSSSDENVTVTISSTTSYYGSAITSDIVVVPMYYVYMEASDYPATGAKNTEYTATITIKDSTGTYSGENSTLAGGVYIPSYGSYPDSNFVSGVASGVKFKTSNATPPPPTGIENYGASSGYTGDPFRDVSGNTTLISMTVSYT